MTASIQERYSSGHEFQEYVADLLCLSGYFEGQIYSTGVSRELLQREKLQFETSHKEKLKRLNRQSYTSPDIMIANRWMDDSPAVEFRFGLSCSRRNRLFDNYGTKSVTLPTYQRRHFENMEKLKHLGIYLVFGHPVDGDYAIGVTKLKEPDYARQWTDQSTGNLRWNDIYYLEKLLSWNSFIEHRIEEGDKEPVLESVKGLRTLWIGDL